MDAGVGAARAGQLDPVAERTLERRGEVAANGLDALLGGKAPERGAEVGDVQADPDRGPLAGRRPALEIGVVEEAQVNSIRAIGALSPWRGPSLRMRV
jgi:hypothetical protein